MNLESGVEFRLRRGGPLPHPVWLGSFEIWNVRLITIVETKKRKTIVTGGSWFVSDLLGGVFRGAVFLVLV